MSVITHCFLFKDISGILHSTKGPSLLIFIFVNINVIISQLLCLQSSVASNQHECVKARFLSLIYVWTCFFTPPLDSLMIRIDTLCIVIYQKLFILINDDTTQFNCENGFAVSYIFRHFLS